MISGPFSVVSSIIVESSQIGLSGKELSAQMVSGLFSLNSPINGPSASPVLS